ncbi:alpha/beta fold hydrolase [Massilia niastensis]|uniref:alpha/beta fold hydrolase n=1 Tax=Massilia niastensis TaxID=544911 RepID=UPI000361BF3F|nr:alpha/beta fold hydrolase [Massilia niastensis]
MNEQAITGPGYWVDLLGAEVRTVAGRYRSRVLSAGSGPALVLLHGTGGHLENYARNIAPLARHFRVIALDFLWHGRSQTEGFDREIIPLLVDQVIDVMDSLEIGSAFVEGQSLGGWVAMRLALAHPRRVRGLVLATTMGYQPDEGAIEGYVEPDWSQNLPSSLEVLRDPGMDNVRSRMARILAHPERLTDEAIRVRQALYLDPALAAVQQEFISEYLAGETIRKYLVTDAEVRRIRQPVLVYWGDRNRTPPALGRRLAQQAPDGRFHCAEDTGHWAQFESADEHNAVVLRFLQDAADNDDKEKSVTDSINLAGRWDIVSWEQLYDDGRRELPLGEQPSGFIRYLPDGDMVCMISRADRKPFAQGGQWHAPVEDKARAYDSMLSYAGRYHVEGDTITHSVEASLFPNWIGGVQKRRWALQDDGTLVLQARLEDDTPQARTARLAWRRHDGKATEAA